MKTHKLALFALALVFIGCKNETLTYSEGVIYPLRGELVDNFADKIQDVEVISLETKDGSYITAIDKMLLSKDSDMIILTSVNISVFDKDGRFKFNVGRIGSGPGEYLKAYDFCISDDQKHILIADQINDILVYNISDGSFVKSMKPNWGWPIPKVTAICPSKDNGFYLFRANPSDVNNFGRSFYCLLGFDSLCLQTSRHLERKDFNLNTDQITQAADQTYFIRPIGGEKTVYKIENGELKKAFDIDFEDKESPLKYIYKNTTNAWEGLSEFINSPYYKLPIYITQTDQFTYFSAIGPEAIACNYLVNRSDNSLIQWYDNKDRFPLKFRTADNEYFYAVFDDFSDYDKSEELWDPLKKHIVNKYNIKLLEKDNPKIIKIRFKQDA